jgi:hypothetical protein
VVNAVEGWGKTTLGAYAPNPFIIMSRGETGFVTLLNAGRVPAADTVVAADGSPKPVESWQELLSVIDALRDTAHENVEIDALGGCERLCHEHVCVRDFKGDWSEKGFGSYQKGYHTSAREWVVLLSRLERLADTGKNILFLSHARLRKFENPTGPNYDRYEADCHEKTWAETMKWADNVLFGTFVTAVSGGSMGDKQEKGKGIGGTMRVLYCEHRDAWDAKNRLGLPESIDIPNDHQAVWPTIWSHFSKGA